MKNDWSVQVALKRNDYGDPCVTHNLHFETKDDALPIYEQAKSLLGDVLSKKNDVPAIVELADGSGGLISYSPSLVHTVKLVNERSYYDANCALDLEHRKRIAAAGLSLRGDAITPPNAHMSDDLQKEKQG